MSDKIKNIDELKNKKIKYNKILKKLSWFMLASIVILVLGFSIYVENEILGIIITMISLISILVISIINKNYKTKIEELSEKIETMDILTKSIEDSQK